MEAVHMDKRGDNHRKKHTSASASPQHRLSITSGKLTHLCLISASTRINPGPSRLILVHDRASEAALRSGQPDPNLLPSPLTPAQRYSLIQHFLMHDRIIEFSSCHDAAVPFRTFRACTYLYHSSVSFILLVFLRHFFCFVLSCRHHWWGSTVAAMLPHMGTFPAFDYCSLPGMAFHRTASCSAPNKSILPIIILPLFIHLFHQTSFPFGRPLPPWHVVPFIISQMKKFHGKPLESGCE